MAEKIVLPKAFTKEWLSYVWDYYRYHILIGIAVIILAVITIVEITTAVKFDTNINYVSTSVISQETADKIAHSCEAVCGDLDKNGEVNVSFSQYNFTDEAIQDANIYSALMNKLMAMFATEEEFVYIVDKNMMEKILNMESTEDLFISANKWAGTKDTDDVYGVSLKNSTVLKELGVDATDLYVMLRMNDNEELQFEEENAKTIANFLRK